MRGLLLLLGCGSAVLGSDMAIPDLDPVAASDLETAQKTDQASADQDVAADLLDASPPDDLFTAADLSQAQADDLSREMADLSRAVDLRTVPDLSPHEDLALCLALRTPCSSPVDYLDMGVIHNSNSCCTGVCWYNNDVSGEMRCCIPPGSPCSSTTDCCTSVTSFSSGTSACVGSVCVISGT